MKQILIILSFMLAYCSLATAQKNEMLYANNSPQSGTKVVTTKTASSGDTAYIPEYTDTPGGVTVESDMEDASDSTVIEYNYSLLEDALSGKGVDSLKDLTGVARSGIALAFFIMLLFFGFPIFIIFIAFYFRYRNRRERYKLVEKAIAAGQPIPENILKESLNNDNRSKGIKNICLGIGLFILLWAFTDSFAMGCIGLLIMFTGIGQYLVAYNQTRRDEPK